MSDRIIFEDVSKFYGEILGVNRVNLSIPPGVTSLVGPNGSGKTTLMNLMTGLIKPSRGSITVLGIPPEDTAIDWNQVIFKGLTIKGIYGREMFETWYKMASMLQSGLKLEPIITHHFPVQEYLKGFETMGSGKSGKVILDWSTL